MGSKGPKLSSCGQRRFWSDWVDAQADLSLRWVHTHFVGFVMSRLIYDKYRVRHGADSVKHDATYRKNSDTQIAVIILKLEQNHFTTDEL